MRNQTLIQSLNSAIEGFVYVFKTQRNMRVHFAIGAIVLLLGIFLNFTYIEMILLCIVVSFVLFAEMCNTAFECTMDMIKEEFHPMARIVKDICAGAVLLSAISSVVVGYLLFLQKVDTRIEDNIAKIKASDWHITFIILSFILAIVVLTKIFFRSGTPLRGGMPSGHAAISFSIWTIIALLYPNSLVVFLVFILAFLVATSRVRIGVHSALEVFIGSLIGVLVTLLIFQIVRA